jgi:hypothetical protein
MGTPARVWGTALTLQTPQGMEARRRALSVRTGTIYMSHAHVLLEYDKNVHLLIPYLYHIITEIYFIIYLMKKYEINCHYNRTL